MVVNLTLCLLTEKAYKAADAALTEVYGKKPIPSRSGGVFQL